MTIGILLCIKMTKLQHTDDNYKDDTRAKKEQTVMTSKKEVTESTAESTDNDTTTTIETTTTEASYQPDTSIPYKWPEENDKFDSVVGIIADDMLLSTGVLIKPRLVLTSANPIRMYEAHELEVYTVRGIFNSSKKLTPDCKSYPFWKFDNNPDTLWHGTDKINCPLHDLLLLTFPNDVATTDELALGRAPYFTPVATTNTTLVAAGIWQWAGFGYIDKRHVEENSKLEVEFFTDAFLDCTEYFPKSWGHFFCIDNKENLLGVASGAPLYHLGHIFGIGSFAMVKGNDSMLVFTDVRRYNIKNAFHCLTDDEEEEFAYPLPLVT